jgi:hypothetical protein
VSAEMIEENIETGMSAIRQHLEALRLKARH